MHNGVYNFPCHHRKRNKPSCILLPFHEDFPFLVRLCNRVCGTGVLKVLYVQINHVLPDLFEPLTDIQEVSKSESRRVLKQPLHGGKFQFHRHCFVYFIQ